jgi:hypothetical protein
MSINANQSVKAVENSIAEVSSQMMLKTKYIVSKQEENKNPDYFVPKKRHESIEFKTEMISLD